MAESKQKIQDGKNVELDGITILNEGISLADKKEEEKNSEEVSTDVSEKSKDNEQEVDLTPDVKIPTEDTPVEEPAISVAPIDISGINTEAPAQEQANDEIPSYDFNNINNISLAEENYKVPFENSPSSFNALNNNENEIPSQGFDANGFVNNYGNVSVDVPEIPNGVAQALEMVKNEALELATKDIEKDREISNLKNENENLRKENASLKEENNKLRLDLSSCKKSIGDAQARILDVFGMGSMNNTQSNNSFGDSEQNNNNMNMVA